MADSSTSIIAEHSEEQVERPPTRKTKVKTQMYKVYSRQEKKLIRLNRQNQPVGPSNEVVIELVSFLGTLAKNAILCPLDIFDWRLMDTKKDLWDYTRVSKLTMISSALFPFILSLECGRTSQI